MQTLIVNLTSKTDKRGILSTRNLHENVWRRKSRQIGALIGVEILHSRKEPNYPTRRKQREPKITPWNRFFQEKKIIVLIENGPF